MTEQRPEPSVTQQRAHQGVKWLIFFRLLLAVISIAVILIGSIGRSGGWRIGPQERAIYTIVTFVCLLNLAYLVALRWIRDYFRYAFAQITLDILIESALVYLTGGVESNFIFLYFASILAASVVLLGRMSIFFASEATILLSGVTIAYYLGYTPFELPAPAEWLRPDRIGSVLTFHFAQTVAFFIVAVLSASMARRLSTARVLSEEILHSVGQGIAAFDADGRLSFVNSEMGRILGRSPPKLSSGADGAFGRPAEKPIARTLAMREGALFDMEFERPGGSRIPLRVKTVPVFSEGRRYRGTVVVLTDLTLERQAEDATAQAERADAISEMSASIAHEIRNPLASIRGAIQEIRRGSEMPLAKRALMDIVLSESDRLDHIISDFLDFARMRPVRKVDADMSAIITESVALIERAAGGKTIAVKADLTGPLPVRVDSEQLRQVLLNLGLNSIAAIEAKGEIRISACAESRQRFTGGRELLGEEEAPDVEGIRVEFVDDGCGMSEETRRRAFDPFFTTRTGGSGLGLAIVSRIIRGHDGRVELASRPGKGATVRFWLPAR